MILLIDNYDSFVHNLARYVRELGEETRVCRNDAITIEEIVALDPSHVIVSPGPCTPRQAGISNHVIAELGARLPILGVCLGHQCLAAALGGSVVRAPQPRHGKTSAILHDGTGLFEGLPSPFQATRYHSLIVEREGLPDSLEVTCSTADAVIMGLKVKGADTWGVQFHPESILTRQGKDLLRNFLDVCGM